MARLNRHEIREVWQHEKASNVRYHITNTGKVIKTIGPRNGQAKMLWKLDNGKLTWNGMLSNKMADIEDFRITLETVAYKL